MDLNLQCLFYHAYALCMKTVVRPSDFLLFYIVLQMDVLPQRPGLKRKAKKLEPKADYLEKKRSDGKWAKRYFDLEQSKLHYFSAKGQKNYRYTITVRGAPIRILDTDKRVIEIESENRTYQLRAKNTTAAAEWLKILQYHSQS